MLDKIQQQKPFLSKSKKRVAQAVLDDPEFAVQASIGALSLQANVSEPTIMRFCKEVGADGFQDFKLRLAKSLGSQGVFFFHNVSGDDNSESLSKKMIDSSIASLVQLKEQLDFAAVDSAIQLYDDCARIEFYGSGGSGVVAEDAQLKFFRLGKPAVAYSDPHIQSAAAALLDSTALVVAISASGQNRDLIHALKIAKGNGVRILAVTKANSIVAELADVCFSTHVSEDSDIYAPIKSRMIQMAILDIIVVAIGIRGGDGVVDKLSKARQAIKFKFVENR